MTWPLWCSFWLLLTFWQCIRREMWSHDNEMPSTNEVHFSILTKHLACTVVAPSAVLDAAAKLASFLFPSSQCHRKKICSYLTSLPAQHTIFFPSLLSQECSTFHIKEALYGFSLANPKCQQHYFCPLGPLLGKMRVTWHKHCDTWTRSGNWAGKSAVRREARPQRGDADEGPPPFMRERAGCREISTLLRRCGNLKRTHYLILKMSI